MAGATHSTIGIVRTAMAGTAVGAGTTHTIGVGAILATIRTITTTIITTTIVHTVHLTTITTHHTLARAV